ncbi:uncharacterized protein [Nicotiana sylvestris]|uniref:uncharacterized protein n=1 Tax=Nicotiana sylvestris TaxID=4096 RepID=UPI00388C47CF
MNFTSDPSGSHHLTENVHHGMSSHYNFENEQVELPVLTQLPENDVLHQDLADEQSEEENSDYDNNADELVDETPFAREDGDEEDEEEESDLKRAPHRRKAAANLGERNRLIQENKMLRSQIQQIRMNADEQPRRRLDEQLIKRLIGEIREWQDGLEKSESVIAELRTQWDTRVNKHRRCLNQVKHDHEKTVAKIKREMATLKFKAVKRARDFQLESRYCYDLLAQMKTEVRQLKNQHIQDSQHRIQKEADRIITDMREKLKEVEDKKWRAEWNCEAHKERNKKYKRELAKVNARVKELEEEKEQMEERFKWLERRINDN